MAQNKITIGALAVMMQGGINEIHEKMDEGFADVHAQIAEVNKKLAAVVNKLELKADKADIDRVLTRISMIGGKVDDYRADQETTQRQVDRHA